MGDGKIGKEIYRFLHTKTQEPWPTLVFGGLPTLDEMSRDYQQPFYGSYTNVRVRVRDGERRSGDFAAALWLSEQLRLQTLPLGV